MKSKQDELNTTIIKAIEELKRTVKSPELLQLLTDRSLQKLLMGLMYCVGSVNDEVNWRFKAEDVAKE